MKSLAKRFFEKPEKIVCIGLGKTGTTTFAKAMKILGYRHKSHGHVFAFANRYKLPMLWTVSRYDSFDDFPWPYLATLIRQHYSRSKFFLTTRLDTDTWLHSLKKHYYRHGPSNKSKLFYGYYSPHENEKHHRVLYETTIKPCGNSFAAIQIFWISAGRKGTVGKKFADF